MLFLVTIMEQFTSMHGIQEAERVMLETLNIAQFRRRDRVPQMQIIPE